MTVPDAVPASSSSSSSVSSSRSERIACEQAPRSRSHKIRQRRRRRRRPSWDGKKREQEPSKQLPKNHLEECSSYASTMGPCDSPSNISMSAATAGCTCSVPQFVRDNCNSNYEEEEPWSSYVFSAIQVLGNATLPFVPCEVQTILGGSFKRCVGDENADVDVVDDSCEEGNQELAWYSASFASDTDAMMGVPVVDSSPVLIGADVIPYSGLRHFRTGANYLVMSPRSHHIPFQEECHCQLPQEKIDNDDNLQESIATAIVDPPFSPKQCSICRCEKLSASRRRRRRRRRGEPEEEGINKMTEEASAFYSGDSKLDTPTSPPSVEEPPQAESYLNKHFQGLHVATGKVGGSLRNLLSPAASSLANLGTRKYTLPDKTVASQVLMYRQLLHTSCKPGLRLSRKYQATSAQKAVVHMPWWEEGVERTGKMVISYDNLIVRLWLNGAIMPHVEGGYGATSSDLLSDGGPNVVDTLINEKGLPPIPHDFWVSRLGFQQSDPVTDFRSGGVLSLAMLVHIVEACPHVHGRFLPRGDAHVLPFGITCINVTDMIAKFLMFSKSVDRIDALLSSKPFWRMFADPNALLALQELSMTLMADVVVELGRERRIPDLNSKKSKNENIFHGEQDGKVTVFDFTYILERTEKRVRDDLLGAGPKTVEELRAIAGRLRIKYQRAIEHKERKANISYHDEAAKIKDNFMGSAQLALGKLKTAKQYAESSIPRSHAFAAAPTTSPTYNDTNIHEPMRQAPFFPPGSPDAPSFAEKPQARQPVPDFLDSSPPSSPNGTSQLVDGAFAIGDDDDDDDSAFL